MQGGKPISFYRVDQDADRGDEQQDRLNCADHVFVAGGRSDAVKNELSGDSAQCGSDGQRRDRFCLQPDPVIPGADQRGNGHGKHRAARQKARRTDGQDPQHIHRGLDDVPHRI